MRREDGERAMASLIVDLSTEFPFFIGGRTKYRVSDWDQENNPHLMFWADVHKDPRKVVQEVLDSDTSEKLKDEVRYLLEDKFFKDRRFSSIYHIALRHVAISRYGFAIPDRHALLLIKKHSPGGVVEIGAGSGYWANLLNKCSVSVAAYDSSTGKYRNGFKYGAHFEVKVAAHDKALADGAHKEKTLLLSWPDYQDSWPAETLNLYKGDTVAYIGEGNGGCTGDDKFHEILEKQWEEVVDYVIPVWWGVHDRLSIYKRKGES